MVDQLFGSKTRVKLIRFFLDNQDQQFYVRELTRLLSEQINSIRRELINLHEVGVVDSREEDNKVFYFLNKSGNVTRGLAVMFGFELSSSGMRTSPPAPASRDSKPQAASKKSKKPVSIKINDAKLKLIKESLEELESVVYASAMGSLVGDNKSSVDLLVVSGDGDNEGNTNLVERAIDSIEKKLNRQLRYINFSESEYSYRLKINDRFISSVEDSSQEILIDRK